MLIGMLSQSRLKFGLCEQAFQLRRERAGVAVHKRETAGTDCPLQAALFRSNNNATASDSLQRDDAERLGPARRRNQNLMLIQNFGEFRALFLSRKCYLSI